MKWIDKNVKLPESGRFVVFAYSLDENLHLPKLAVFGKVVDATIPKKPFYVLDNRGFVICKYSEWRYWKYLDDPPEELIVGWWI